MAVYTRTKVGESETWLAKMNNNGHDSTLYDSSLADHRFHKFPFWNREFSWLIDLPLQVYDVYSPYKFTMFTVTDYILYDYSLIYQFVLTSFRCLQPLNSPCITFSLTTSWLINLPWPVFGVYSPNQFSVFTGKDFQVRLVDENGQANQGRVEVFYNGAWGTVCDDKFDRNAAAVVCTRMGYERYSCMAVYTFVQEVQLYGWVYLCTRGAVVWLCIPLYKRCSCIAVYTYVQEVQWYGWVYLCTTGTVV